LTSLKKVINAVYLIILQIFIFVTETQKYFQKILDMLLSFLFLVNKVILWIRTDKNRIKQPTEATFFVATFMLLNYK